MKTLWKRATGLLLSSALIFSLAACGGGTGDTNTKQPDDSGSAQASEPAMPDSGATGEKLIYTNGGPEEFFETPWLNPGTYVYNKAVYGHTLWPTRTSIPSRTIRTPWPPMSIAPTARP